MYDPSFYFDRLYPFQDQILDSIRMLATGFYLTGGTAASRGYLNHRFSEDLDLFVNDDRRFGLWTERVIHALSLHQGWNLRVLLKEERFARMGIRSSEVSMKIELVNDVPSHVGAFVEHGILGRLDSAENILANKITAVMDRNEPKDMADIWGFCCRRGGGKLRDQGSSSSWQKR
jgi:predicted nucleotidyltransferase component of viral defense system